MNNEEKSPQRVSESTFAKAFTKLFKCETEDIDIRITTEDHEAVVIYNGQGYKISTKAILRDYIEFQLSDRDGAQSIHLPIWIEATKHSVSISRFLPNLVDKLQDAEQAQILHLALSINSFSEDKYDTFWNTLLSVDIQGDLFGNAIVSAREVYNKDGLLEDITELMIINGRQTYNMIVEGIFETVTVTNTKGNMITFYIYSAEVY